MESSSSTSNISKDKMSQFKNRLAKLHTKRNEAARLNHKEVVEEDRIQKMPKNTLKKRERLEKELTRQEEKIEAEKEGKDYDRLKMLNVSAVDAERWERKKRKQSSNEGFSSFEAATKRQYDRLVKTIKFNSDDYEREKESVGEAAFYGQDNTISIGLHNDSSEAIDDMVKDLEKQEQKRETYSRRRVFDDDDDVNYINERNMRFNKKLERFYGQYTDEIKQNLERGTAV